MKVVFKLTSDQFETAKNMRYEHQKVSSVFGNDSWRDVGNIMPFLKKRPQLNAEQSLNLVGWGMGASHVIYEGHREALHHDGGLLILANIAGFHYVEDAIAQDFHTLEVIEYKTSDHRLKWYETLDLYIRLRGSVEDISKHLTLPLTRQSDLKRKYYRRSCL